MNHYPRNIGDYVKDTLGLSMEQDGAYTRLMDQYYASEKPLPKARSELYAIARCGKPSERKAVDFVLTRYFTETAAGWRQKRCDVELEEMIEKSKSASRAAKRRWTERNANADANALPNADEPHMRNGCETDARQEPRTKNQEPGIEAKSKALSSNGAARHDDALRVLAFLNEKTERHFRPGKATTGLIEARLHEGATVGECKAVVMYRLRAWQADDKMRDYLRPSTLFAASKFANYLGDVPQAEDLIRGD